ncbi:probable sorbitol utilization protein SOU2 [Rhynchosporium secalis]|uniref:Probable sorbitol utilization protein SOU2 n=1 Tax=Rhynchosporium secalis TaxID=38038 RepID=A0A1E1M907_RHYSE|nr:probable sorbitol utilization protein SOU2 [Rhynchosporium secalis]
MSPSLSARFSLEGRTAIITGAAAGLGLVIAEALAEAGANVALLYFRNGEAIAAAQGIEKSYDVQARAYQVDVTESDAVEEAVDRVVMEFNGRLDIFIANSGMAWEETTVLSSPISAYRHIMATNLDSVYFCARSAGKHFCRQHKEKTTFTGELFAGEELVGFKRGSFIATASMSAHVVNYPHVQTAYNASKAGVVHMCKSLAVEWADFARVNTVSPGFIRSGLTAPVPEDVQDQLKEKTPLRQIGELDEMKDVYLYLASDASSFTTGTDIIADGGYTLW